jgi:hypothetical protein
MEIEPMTLANELMDKRITLIHNGRGDKDEEEEEDDDDVILFPQSRSGSLVRDKKNTVSLELSGILSRTLSLSLKLPSRISETHSRSKTKKKKRAKQNQVFRC